MEKRKPSSGFGACTASRGPTSTPDAATSMPIPVVSPTPSRRELLNGLLALAAGSISANPAFARSRSAPKPDVILGRIGDVKIARIEETVTFFQASSWFPDLRKDDLAPYLGWLAPRFYDPATGLFPLPMQTWVLRSKGKIVVIDTGYGNDKSRPGLVDADCLKTPYLKHLRSVGITPEQVDFVLCTHLHLDHTGWNTRLKGGRWIPTFPNAKYIWSLADQQDSLSQASELNPVPFTRGVYNDSILPVIQAGLAFPITDVFKISEEILLRPAPGHSPGTLRIELRSKGQTAVFCGDMLHSPLQIPLWRIGSAGDFDRPAAARARHALLDFCVEENAVLIPGHFSSPHVARIRRDGESFLPLFGGLQGTA